MPDESTRIETAYAQQVHGGGKEADRGQAQAVAALARLERELAPRRLPWRRTPVRGVYLHGPVGRGKTWLMDLFYRVVPVEQKLRRHFHAFMLEEVHRPLRHLRHQRDPLLRLARVLARRARIICFDELLVEDIADAMLLGPLLQALFQNGVALVATANVPPHELYRGGLKREHFLPAIAALEAHCEIVAVDGARDFRSERLGEAGAYRITETNAGRSELAALFAALAGATARPGTVTLNRRAVAVGGASEDTVLVDFARLCAEARSAADYIELAERYRLVLLAGVPVLDDDSLDAVRRFIALIDVLYERRTLLIVAAEAEPDALYRGRRFRFEFRRSISRLEEMRSKDYLAGAHLARAPVLIPL